MAVRRSAALLAAGVVATVRADLPIHCLAEDVFGDWEISSDGAPMDSLSACGHDLPNSVPSMLKLVDDDAKVGLVGSPPKERFVVTLTDRTAVGAGEDPHLVAVGPDGTMGTWTMVYDEGLEVRLGDRRYATKFEFKVLPWKKASEGDLLDKIGKYFYRAEGHTWKDFPDPIYGVHCDRTSPGWHSRPGSTAGSFRHGCFTARRLPDAVEAANVTTGLASLGRRALEARDRRAGERFNPPSLDFASLAWVNATGPGKEFVRADGRKDLWSLPPSDADRLPAGVSRPLLRTPMLLRARAHRTLPVSFDWREAPELQRFREHGDVLSQQTDQGGCGSCYAFAASTQLAMRFRIELARRGHSNPVDLSWRAFVGCSTMSEGCSGGWPYFVGKIAREEGLFQVTTSAGPEALCRADDNPSLFNGAACSPHCSHGSAVADKQPVWYAKDYGYVGGFERGASEESLMRELFENGPVTLELATKTVAYFVYGAEGSPSGTMRSFDNGATIDDKVVGVQLMSNSTGSTTPGTEDAVLNKWMWVDHVIVGVGWGQEPLSKPGTTVFANKPQASLLARGTGVEDGQLKYWTIRNSWGTTWGQGGYAKLIRGVNAAGVEMSSVWISPDLDRIPKQYK